MNHSFESFSRANKNITAEHTTYNIHSPRQRIVDDWNCYILLRVGIMSALCGLLGREEKVIVDETWSWRSITSLYPNWWGRIPTPRDIKGVADRKEPNKKRKTTSHVFMYLTGTLSRLSVDFKIIYGILEGILCMIWIKYFYLTFQFRRVVLSKWTNRK